MGGTLASALGILYFFLLCFLDALIFRRPVHCHSGGSGYFEFTPLGLFFEDR